MAAFGPILVVFVALCGISIGQGDENRLHPHHAERELPSPHGRYPMRGSPQTLHGRNREPTETAKKLDLGSRKSLEATRHALDGKVGSDRAFLIAHMTDDDEDVVEVPTDSCDERNFPCALGHRRYSGWCNNMQNPRFGASHSLYQRLLPPAYDDDVNSPRSVGVSGRLLPSPRKITTTVFGLASHESNERTIWMMQWGQFLDHDISRTPNSVETDGSFPKCPDCSTTANPLCLPIIIPANDPHFPPSRGCMNFVRSSNGRLSLGRREQISIISAYIDASQVYGSDDCVASSLRAEDDGLLKTSDDGKMLPKSPDNGFCRSDSIDCFLAGDIRVNENIALTSVQTLWLLEHNRIATELKGINPSWDDETLYQETRKIIIAMHQHINYKEYIPKVIGPDLTDEFDILPRTRGFYNGYDSNVDATLLNEFSTAAYRFGHSLVQDQYELRRGRAVSEKLDLVNTFSDPSAIVRPNFLDRIFSGMSGQSSQMCDNQFSETLRDRLFEAKDKPFSGFDLPAFNIQRGRDHGLPPYVAYRRLFNLRVPRSFDDLKTIMDPATVEGLKKTYVSVDDIDLYVGIVSERALPGAAVGPTAARIIADQFSRLKKGDRYWYERRSALLFTIEQLNEIRKVSLAKVICTHANIDIQRDVFLNPTVAGNGPRKCSSLPEMDLTLWKQES